MANDDLRTWAKNAAGLGNTPDSRLDFSQVQQIERLMEHADTEPRTTYRGYDGYTFRSTYHDPKDPTDDH